MPPTPTPELDTELDTGMRLATELANHCLNGMGAAGCKLPVTAKYQVNNPDDQGVTEREVELYVIVEDRANRERLEAVVRRFEAADVPHLLARSADEIRRLKETVASQQAQLEVLEVFKTMTGVIREAGSNRGGAMCLGGAQTFESHLADVAADLEHMRRGEWQDEKCAQDAARTAKEAR